MPHAESDSPYLPGMYHSPRHRLLVGGCGVGVAVGVAVLVGVTVTVVPVGMIVADAAFLK